MSIVNLKNYVKADGTDETELIQNVINDCKGKTLFIPGGTYSVRALRGISNISVVGEADTVIRYFVSESVKAAPLLQFDGFQNFSVDGITLDGQGKAFGTVFQVINSSNVLIKNTTSQSQLLKDKIDMAFHVAQGLGKQLVFKGFLWHQGEGDYQSPDDAAYKARMITLISNIRGWCRNASLPFFFGSISLTSAQYNATVETAQRQIAVEVPNCYIVDMSAGTLLDPYHFDAASTQYFGNEVFNLMKTVIG